MKWGPDFSAWLRGFSAFGGMSLLPRRRERERGAARRRVVRPWREDAQRTYATLGMTPTRIRALLHSADAGQPQGLFDLYAEMQQKWPRLASVAATRRLALTGLEWQLDPADESAAAQRAADYGREALRKITRLSDALGHLAGAIGHGLAVGELVWERGALADIVPVPHSRLMGDPDEPWRLCVRTEEEPARGVPLDAQPRKWIVHQPRGEGARPFDGGLLRPSVGLFVAQHLSFRDWLVYSQIAGMPLRVAQFEPGLPDSEQDALLRVMEQLGTDAVAVMSKNVDLKLLEARRGEQPYPQIQDYCNRELTILWLGQHLTTDMGSSGSRAAAQVHDRVREDLLVADIADEARTIERDLLAPLTLARFGERVPPPRFRRSLVQSMDTQQLAQTLAVAVERLGLRVPAAWAHEALGIPAPRAGQAVLRSGTAGEQDVDCEDAEAITRSMGASAAVASVDGGAA